MIYNFVVAFLQPFPLCYYLTLVALASVCRKNHAIRRQLLVVAAPFALLGIVSLPIVGHLALGSLEWRYSQQNEVPSDTGALVVLSGYARPPADAASEAELGTDTLLRCEHAVKLYKSSPRPVLVSGGSIIPGSAGPTLAATMRDFLVRQGVCEEHVLLEDRSATTYENALFSGDVLARKGINKIVLVTSASHMPRAADCFRAQGFRVVPSSCDYHTARAVWSPSDFLLPNPQATTTVGLVVHEWLGMAWYWLWGRL